MNDKMKAALAGGAVAGVLSIIPIASGCCFLWAIAGGALAVFIYNKNAPAQMQTGDGAMLGLMTGGIAAIIYLIIGLPLALFVTGATIQQAFQQAGMRDLPIAGTALAILIALLVALILVGFTTLGGVIGVAIFGKNRPGTPPTPPPPAGFGGQPPVAPFGGPGFGGPPPPPPPPVAPSEPPTEPPPTPPTGGGGFGTGS
jgi:hypothetical protein